MMCRTGAVTGGSGTHSLHGTRTWFTSGPYYKPCLCLNKKRLRSRHPHAEGVRERVAGAGDAQDRVRHAGMRGQNLARLAQVDIWALDAPAESQGTAGETVVSTGGWGCRVGRDSQAGIGAGHGWSCWPCALLVRVSLSRCQGCLVHTSSSLYPRGLIRSACSSFDPPSSSSSFRPRSTSYLRRWTSKYAHPSSPSSSSAASSSSSCSVPCPRPRSSLPSPSPAQSDVLAALSKSCPLQVLPAPS